MMIKLGNRLGSCFSGVDEQNIAFVPHYAMHQMYPEDAAVAAQWAETWRREEKARWA